MYVCTQKNTFKVQLGRFEGSGQVRLLSEHPSTTSTFGWLLLYPEGTTELQAGL